jgi:hypothetical protein
MTVIANLDVQLGARTEKWDAGLDKAASKADRFRGNVQGAVGGELFDAASNGINRLVGRFPGVEAGIGAFGRVASAAGSLGPAGIAAGAAVGVAFAGIAAGAAAAAITIAGVRREMQNIDDTLDVAHKLGQTFAEVVLTRRSLGETSGLGDTEIDASMTKLQLNLAEAASGSGKLYDTLTRVGVDAGQLLQMGPVEQMRVLSQVTQGMQNPTDQLTIAYELFGKQGAALVASLREGPGHMEEMAKHAAAVGLTLSDAQAEQVGAANDAWTKVTDIATGAFRQIAAEVAPVLTTIFENIEGLAGPIQGWHVLLPTIVDNTVQWSGFIYDAAELASVMHTTLYKIVTLDWSGVGENIQSAMTFDTGDKWLAQVAENRKKAAEAAKNSAVTRGSESDLAKIEKEHEAADSAAKEAKNAAKEAEKLEEQRTKKIQDRLASMREELQVMQDIKRFQSLGFDASEAKKMADDAKEMRQFADGANLGGPLVGEIERMQAERRALEENQERMAELEKSGADVRKKNAESTPDGKFAAETRELRRLLREGAINNRDFEKAAGRAIDELQQANGGGPQASATIGAGSKEAYKLMVDSQNSAAKQVEKQVMLAEQQVELARESVAAIRAIQPMRAYR